MTMRKYAFLYVAFFLGILCSCNKETKDQSWALLILGDWNGVERLEIARSNGDNTETFRDFSIAFYQNNTGTIASLIETSFDWLIQTDPDRLMIAQKLNSQEPGNLDLYFVERYNIRMFSSDEIILQTERTYVEDAVHVSEQRYWTLTR